MAGRKRDEVIKALLAKGFVQTEGAKHIKLQFARKPFEKTGISTVFSRGAREIGDDLLAKIAFQLRLTLSELREFLDCEISEDGYVEILNERGIHF